MALECFCSMYFERLYQMVRGKCMCGPEWPCQYNWKISVSAFSQRHSNCCCVEEVALSNWQERGIIHILLSWIQMGITDETLKASTNNSFWVLYQLFWQFVKWSIGGKYRSCTFSHCQRTEKFSTQSFLSFCYIYKDY